METPYLSRRQSTSPSPRPCACLVASVVSDSYATLWTVAARLLSPWDFPGKNTGVGCHALLQGIFPTQEWNPWLLHFGQVLYHGVTGKPYPTSSPKQPSVCILSVYIYPFWTFHKWNHSILWMASLACFQGSSVVWHVVMATKITRHGLNINCRSMTHLYHEKKECDRMKWNLKLIPLSSWSLRHCFGWKQQVIEQKAYPII